MKIIFLDFDGVIRIPVPTGGPNIEAEFCGDRMKRVANLTLETGARIVISSDWRMRYDWAGIAALLEPNIPRGLMHRDWMTPTLTIAPDDSNLEIPPPRGAEIVTWLAQHPEVTEFAVFDDMQSKYFPLMKDRLVTCQLLDGFTEERRAYAHAILG